MVSRSGVEWSETQLIRVALEFCSVDGIGLDFSGVYMVGLGGLVGRCLGGYGREVGGCLGV